MSVHSGKSDICHCEACETARIVAFVQGAQWWEYTKTKATMWGSDRDKAERAAKTRADSNTLGRFPNVTDKEKEA